LVTLCEKMLQQQTAEPMNTLILGCTHYPLLKRTIREVVGKKISLVDSAESCADYVQARLGELRLLNKRKRIGRIQPYVTDETDRFAELAKRFLSAPLEPACKVDLPVL
jgi:glutamate racemase